MSAPKPRGGARPGAGRPIGPDGPAQRVQVTIPERVLEALDARAEATGETRSGVIVAAVRRALRR